MRSLSEAASNAVPRAASTASPRPTVLRAALVSLWFAIAWIPGCTLAATDNSPTESEIARALDVVKADPNLATETKQRVPFWHSGEERETTRRSGVQWLRDLFRWIGQASRALLWVMGIVFIGALVLVLIRLVRNLERPAPAPAGVMPTHIQNLDIRPESLPDDIGAASLQLWNRNEHRAALALLYRGLVSRLVHVHQVPIRQSTTEAGCIELAGPRMCSQSADYVARLVRTWQRSVYGGQHPSDEEVRALCAIFDATLAPLAADATRKAS